MADNTVNNAGSSLAQSVSLTIGFSSNSQPWIAKPQRYDTTLDCFIREPEKKQAVVAQSHASRCAEAHAKELADKDNAFERFCGWCGSFFDR